MAAARVRQGPLTEANGFRSQADVLIETRRAADLVGATKMDRPEDVEANPPTGAVYVMSPTIPPQGRPGRPANPWPKTASASRARSDEQGRAGRLPWEILVKCGDPSIAAVGATFNPSQRRMAGSACPTTAPWTRTAGCGSRPTATLPGRTLRPGDGWRRAHVAAVLPLPSGAEMCGPYFTGDGETVFLAVQHPGEGDEDDPKAAPATFEQPAIRFPARPAAEAVGGGRDQEGRWQDRRVGDRSSSFGLAGLVPATHDFRSQQRPMSLMPCQAGRTARPSSMAGPSRLHSGKPRSPSRR